MCECSRRRRRAADGRDRPAAAPAQQRRLQAKQAYQKALELDPANSVVRRALDGLEAAEQAEGSKV